MDLYNCVVSVKYVYVNFCIQYYVINLSLFQNKMYSNIKKMCIVFARKCFCFKENVLFNEKQTECNFLPNTRYIHKVVKFIVIAQV